MSRDRRQTEEDEIARHILDYLTDHPEAGDTLEGIVQWWLMERHIQKMVLSVSGIVTDLVQKGALIQETIAGTCVYRISSTIEKVSKDADDR